MLYTSMLMLLRYLYMGLRFRYWELIVLDLELKGESYNLWMGARSNERGSKSS